MPKPHRRAHLITFILPVLFVANLGCEHSDDSAGGSPPDVSADPRCNSLCSDTPPMPENFFAVCSDDSLSECADLCETRIADVSGLCAECLLEGAQFRTPDEDQYAHEVCLADGTCYLGLSAWCSNGCWISPTSRGSCEEFDCEGKEALASYAEEVTQGSACVFSMQDAQSRDRCYEQQYPRTEQACSVEFAGVAQCAEICGAT